MTHDLREITVSNIEGIVREYCRIAKPTNIYLAFKREIDSELVIETKYPLPEENIIVLISDIRKDDYPKSKQMNKGDFEKTFEILSYTVQEESQVIMKVIDKLGLHKWEHEGKLKRFHYFQGAYNK